MSDQRQLGVDAFNETWRLMLSRENDELMLDCAHASRYHWALAPECEPENRARSAWLLSRAYVVAGNAEEFANWAALAGRLAEVIVDPENKSLIESQLAEIPIP